MVFLSCLIGIYLFCLLFDSPDQQPVEKEKEKQFQHQEALQQSVGNNGKVVIRKISTKSVDVIALKQFTMYLDPVLIDQPAKAGAYDEYLRNELTSRLGLK
jgi:hypothetical protein